MTTLAGWRRRRRRRGEWSTAELPDDAVPDDDGTATVELRCALLAALGRLPVGQRAVLALRFLEDLSERETAEALGVSAGTVKSRTSRALASLRGVEGLRELVATVDAPAETSVSPLTPVTPERRTRWPAVAEGQG
jgi:DNA-directed RNA polymerase specialized sigma24 family protein